MRPPLEEIKSGTEFIKWYWLKQELIAVCDTLGLPKSGSKFELRDRIAHFIDTGEILRKNVIRKQSKFNWAKEKLTCETVITDNVKFGRNFREFMKIEVGTSFSFNTSFMDWVKNHPGKTLKDAIDHWIWLEREKKNPAYKSKIASHNMYNQFLRDYFQANPMASLESAKASWERAKQSPNEDGFVRYKMRNQK